MKYGHTLLSATGRSRMSPKKASPKKSAGALEPRNVATASSLLGRPEPRLRPIWQTQAPQQPQVAQEAGDRRRAHADSRRRGTTGAGASP